MSIDEHVITLIIKPSHNCNLRCTYCYDNPNKIYHEVMSFDMAKEVMEKFSKYNDINIIWHGGEPLLIDLENFYKPIYKDVIPNLNHKVLISSFQSNGTIYNENLRDFLKENDLTLGMSFDGLWNEETRKSTKKYLENMELASKDGLNFWSGCLAVATPDNADKLVDCYKYCKDLGISITFNELFKKNMTKEEYQVIIDGYIKLL
jgi:uncharacterized protein